MLIRFPLLILIIKNQKLYPLEMFSLKQFPKKKKKKKISQLNHHSENCYGFICTTASIPKSLCNTYPLIPWVENAFLLTYLYAEKFGNPHLLSKRIILTVSKLNMYGNKMNGQTLNSP